MIKQELYAKGDYLNTTFSQQAQDLNELSAQFTTIHNRLLSVVGDLEDEITAFEGEFASLFDQEKDLIALQSPGNLTARTIDKTLSLSPDTDAKATLPDTYSIQLDYTVTGDLTKEQVALAIPDQSDLINFITSGQLPVKLFILSDDINDIINEDIDR